MAARNTLTVLKALPLSNNNCRKQITLDAEQRAGNTACSAHHLVNTCHLMSYDLCVAGALALRRVSITEEGKSPV